MSQDDLVGLRSLGDPHASEGEEPRRRRRILLVEDEPGLVTTLSDYLQDEGYDVESTEDGRAGHDRALAEDFDLVLLDVMLPKKNGYDVCRDLRRVGYDTPILMLTARGELRDRVLGLRIGADDYLAKPFDPLELLVRMEALLRRSKVQPRIAAKEIFRTGDLVVDMKRTEVRRQGRRIDLSVLEFRLLRYFIEHRGETLSRNALLDDVWRYDPSVYSRTVDVHVSNLRQKIERDPAKPDLIVTVYGMGYRFMG